MADRLEKFSDRARRVFTYAQEESQRHNHNYISTEHLLLGLVRVEDGVAAMVLTNLGAKPSSVRSAVEFAIGHTNAPMRGWIGLTPRGKKVIELAVAEARLFDRGQVGTEHLLLGLAGEGEGVAYGVLESMGISLESARAETVRVLSAGSASARRESVLAMEALSAINGAMAAIETLSGEDLATELARAVFLPALRSISSDLNLLAGGNPPAGYYVEIRRGLDDNLRLLEEAARVFERHDVEQVASALTQAATSLRTVVG